MTGTRSETVTLVDPDVRSVGVDLDDLVAALQRQGLGAGLGLTMVTPGLARHPELLTGAVKASGARRAIIVTAEFECPPLSELRMWGEAGGLSPLGVQAVNLDILRAHRSAEQRAAYAVRMVRAAACALDAAGTPRAARRSVGSSLSRRGLLRGRATTWVPVIEVDSAACLGTARCERCVQACPEDALRVGDDVLGAPPEVDTSRCVACSGCLDVCPAGALALDGHDPRTLARQLRALLLVEDDAPTPALIISCRSAVEPLHHLGERDGLPGWLVLELPCIGGVGSAWYLAALAAGAPTVQVLPCPRCRERGALAAEVLFTRRLLEALGDTHALQRAGVLPEGGSRLRRATRAADGLTPLVDRTGADRMPIPDTLDTTAHVAAWAVGELQGALAGDGKDQELRLRVVHGQGSPLGILRAADGCTACGVCARSCPSEALTLTAGSGSTGLVQLVLDPAGCTGCGVCVGTCPESVLDVVPGVDLDLLAAGCVPIAAVAVADCVDCGQPVPPLPATTHLTALPAALASRCPPCRQRALLASG